MNFLLKRRPRKLAERAAERDEILESYDPNRCRWKALFISLVHHFFIVLQELRFHRTLTYRN